MPVITVRIKYAQSLDYSFPFCCGRRGSGPQICIKCQMPYVLFTLYHLMWPRIRTPPSSGLFLATIYNQSQLTERKHVARYWSISAVPVSAHPSPLVITTKFAAAILVVAVVSTG